jgi:hypothetical protein
MAMKMHLLERANGLLVLSSQKKDRLPKIRLKSGLFDNRIERSKSKACSASSLGKVIDYICLFDGMKRR